MIPYMSLILLATKTSTTGTRCKCPKEYLVCRNGDKPIALRRSSLCLYCSKKCYSAESTPTLIHRNETTTTSELEATLAPPATEKHVDNFSRKRRTTKKCSCKKWQRICLRSTMTERSILRCSDNSKPLCKNKKCYRIMELLWFFLATNYNLYWDGLKNGDEINIYLLHTVSWKLVTSVMFIYFEYISQVAVTI